jgi:O-antigen ligase
MLQKIGNLLQLEDHPQKWLMLLLAVAIPMCIFVSIKEGIPILMFAPAGILVAWLAIVDFKKIYFLMLAAIPISIEFEIGSFGTDLPSEPLILALFLISIVWFFKNWHIIDARFLKHPITWMLLLHLSWMLICVVMSMGFVVSLKFFLAKTWYVVVFYFLTGKLIQSQKDFRWLVWSFFLSLVFTVFSVLARHASTGFSFDSVNYVMGPFYRNHVMYACVQAIFIPFVWYLTYSYKKRSQSWWILVLGILTFLVGINFAYTRAAYVALVAAIGIYWCIRFKILRIALLAFVLLLSLFIGWVTYRDNYLLFSPDFEHAVSHKQFESLLEATTKLEDISIMERVYRWVGASNMIVDHPWTGFGPGNFYPFYRFYTVTSFETYVSDNPERSGIHCYYLMTAVEQGIIGALLFIVFCGFVMVYSERIYHQTKNLENRRILVAASLSFMLICLLMLMNDFVETDKIGSFFFICAALIVNIDIKNREKMLQENN